MIIHVAHLVHISFREDLCRIIARDDACNNGVPVSSRLCMLKIESPLGLISGTAARSVVK